MHEQIDARSLTTLAELCEAWFKLYIFGGVFIFDIYRLEHYFNHADKCTHENKDDWSIM